MTRVWIFILTCVSLQWVSFSSAPAWAQDAGTPAEPNPIETAREPVKKISIVPVDKNLFRGGTIHSNFSVLSTVQYKAPLLQQAGIKTVITLQWSGDSGYDYKVVSPVLAQHGIDFISYPLSEHVSGMDEQKVDRLMTLVTLIGSPEIKKPILVHCRLGVDRTGLFVALYRVIHNGFTPEAAFEDMLNHRFDRIRVDNVDQYYKSTFMRHLRRAQSLRTAIQSRGIDQILFITDSLYHEATTWGPDFIQTTPGRIIKLPQPPKCG